MTFIVQAPDPPWSTEWCVWAALEGRGVWAADADHLPEDQDGIIGSGDTRAAAVADALDEIQVATMRLRAWLAKQETEP